MIAHLPRPRGWMLLALLLALAAILATPRNAAPQVDSVAAVVIRARLESAVPAANGTDLRHVDLLRPIYSTLRYEPAWSPAHGEAILAAVLAASEDGLRSDAYHAVALEALLGSQGRPAEGVPSGPARAELDLLLSDAFVGLAHDLAVGRVDPRAVHPTWTAPRPRTDLALVFDDARSIGPERALDRVRPRSPEYGELRGHLAALRRIERSGGWPTLPAGSTLRAGDRGAGVALLHARLLPEHVGGPGADSFDATLEAAVRRFQETHGLEVDGVVGPRTRAALNVPAGERIRQIELNLERLRWTGSREDRYVEVRIPGFELRVVEGGVTALRMPVVGGRVDRRTPIFSGRLETITFSPYWHVPPGIAAADIVPEARRDPTYFGRNHIEVLVGTGAAARRIDPRSVDWSAVDPRTMPYRFRQTPGAHNSLGRVKFEFPNRHNVFLHDTPHPELFAQAERAFSSGCIRLARPADLAAYLLATNGGWGRAEIERAMMAGSERSVRLLEPIPVHILYLTATAKEDGTILFHRDLYGHDPPLDAALAR